MPLRELSHEERDRFLALPTVAVLVTRRVDGSPMLSPVWFEWQAGHFWFVIGSGDVKHRALTREPRVSVCVFGQLRPYPGVEALGTARVAEGWQEAHDRMFAIASRYVGASDAARFLAAIPVGELISVVLDVDRMRTFDQSDIPGLEHEPEG